MLTHLTTIPINELFISTITISEIVYGTMKSNRADFHLHNMETILLPSVNVVGFDSKAAYICGQLRAQLEKKGAPLDLADLEIASICIADNFMLITGNSKHFSRINTLRHANWL